MPRGTPRRDGRTGHLEGDRTLAQSKGDHGGDAGTKGALFLLLGLGELARLVLLALVGASGLAGADADPLVAGPLLLVYLAPHAALAAAFVFMARPSAAAPWLRLVVPAKLIGFVAAATTCGIEAWTGDRTAVSLAAIGTPLPIRFLLALVAAWDLAVLATFAVRALLDHLRDRGTPAPPAPPRAGDSSANPVFHEVDVVEVEDRPPDRE